MRKPEYLSPTAFAAWSEDRDKFYMRYLADHKLPREPQTQPMAVGSSFDAYIKSYLHDKLIGDKNPKYQFEALFESQVEPHNRDKARVDGKHVFDTYVDCGAVSDLMKEMNDCIGQPRFEFEIRQNIQRNGREVTFLGKPDVYFVTKENGLVILDFKVNGYYAKASKSPMPGYARLFPTFKSHGDFIGKVHKGMLVNNPIYGTLDYYDVSWARQTSIYAWLCGYDIGGDWISAIDQIVAKPGVGQPTLRVAQHRHLVKPGFQFELFEACADVWNVMNGDWIFKDLSYEDSQQRCKLLDKRVEMLANISPEDFDFYNLVSKKRFF